MSSPLSHPRLYALEPAPKGRYRKAKHRRRLRLATWFAFTLLMLWFVWRF